MATDRRSQPVAPAAALVVRAGICGLLLAAAPVRALNLAEAFDAAQTSDPTYAAARAQYQATVEKKPQALAALLPQIAAVAQTTRTNLDYLTGGNPISPVPGFTLGGVTQFSVTGWNLTLTQPLFDWGRWEQFQQGELAAAAAEIALMQARQDLITRTAQAYFDVLAAEDNVALARSKRESIRQQLDQAKRNFEVGTATITDSNEAQARLDLAVAAEVAAQSDLVVKRGALEQLIGRPAGELAPLRAPVRIPGPEPMQADDWIRQAEQSNAAVGLAQAGLDIARRENRRAIAGHLPTVALVGSHGYTSQTGSAFLALEQKYYSNTIGLQVTVPIFTGGYQQSRVREAAALEEKGRADLEAARRGASQGARTAFQGVSSGLAQVRALEAAEQSADVSLQSNKLAYEVGVRINIDVLNAQDQLYGTRVQLAKARYDTIVAGLRLKAAANVLKDDDVGLVNSLLTGKGK